MHSGIIVLLIMMLSGLISCQRKPAVERHDTMTSGEATVAIDECFLPFMREEIAVFQGINEDATIHPLYVSEKEAFDLLFKDSVRLIVAGRNITEAEKERLKDMKLIPRSIKIAEDAVALIVHASNKDTIVSIPTLKKMMTGKITRWNQLNPHSSLGTIQVVFDHPSSSTIRYINEKVCQKEPLATTFGQFSPMKQFSIMWPATPMLLVSSA